MEDGIPGGLQYCHKMCCEKGGCHGRRTCMVRKWFHHRDIISGQVDLYMTLCLYCGAEDYKLDSCSKKQTMVLPKNCSALATADTPAAVSKQSSAK